MSTLAEKIQDWKDRIEDSLEDAENSGEKAQASRNVEFPKDTRDHAGKTATAMETIREVLFEVFDELDALEQRVTVLEP